MVIVDDMISTGGSIAEAARLVSEHGAKKVSCCVTHALLCGSAPQRLQEAPVDEIVVTDTIPISKEAQKLGNIKILSCDVMLGEAIRRIYKNESISSLFRK